MSSVTVTFVQQDGTEKTITSDAIGTPLMEIARSNGVAGIQGDCNGGADCGTCHVHVPAEWLEIVGTADDVELSTLDMASNLEDNSRLSCQIKLSPEIDGLKLFVATDL